VDVTELAFPDTPIAVASRDFAREVSSDAVYNHCERTYGFGVALGERERWDFDQEVFYVASLLHDLGLVERFDGPDDFEVNGANAAHAFVTQQGWDDAKADLVREAIALHMRVGTEDHDRKEVPLVRLGAAVDVLGWGLEDVPKDLTERLLADFPRANLKAELIRLMGDQMQRKPDSWIALMGANLDWLDRIRDAPFEE
jgi:hypothetical protein